MQSSIRTDRPAGLRALLLIALWPAFAVAQEEAAAAVARLEAARVEAGRELVAPLESLVEWCQANRLYRERDRVYGAIVSLAPEHRAARRALRHHRLRGEWVPSEAYRVPRNRTPEKLPEFNESYDAVVGGYRGTVLRILFEERKHLRPEDRDDALRGLLAFDPDDAAVRGALGEAQWHGRWLLRESVATLNGRAALALIARTSLAITPEPESSAPTDEERSLGLLWSSVLETPRVRVLGTVGSDEVGGTAKVTHAIGEYFRNVFRRSQPSRDDFRILLLGDNVQRERLLGALGLPLEEAQLVRTAAGGWLGSDNLLGEWSPDPRRRLDGAARQTLGTLLIDAYGIDARHGWAWEGIGLYLVYNMIGTRMTYFIERSSYLKPRNQTLWTQLQAPGANWIEEGRAMLTSEGGPHLEFLVGRNVASMRDEDILFAYVVAAYLLEGRPTETPDLLARLGAGEHPADAFNAALGASLPQIDARIRRWLEEIRIEGESPLR
ncbi:MAG: hypothetical protein E2O39_13065 [Planctomycetota bacterium]|nr:MAG: hypothetical protein E2O39_13065 [Planctomycetota bacterium]